MKTTQQHKSKFVYERKKPVVDKLVDKNTNIRGLVKTSKTQPLVFKTIKPKLLIVSDSYLPRWDGIAKFLFDILPELKKQFNVTIIAPDFPGKRLAVTGVKEILMPIGNLRYGDYQLPQFKKALVKQAIKDTDLVWTHTIGPLGKNIISLAKAKKKTVVSYIHSVDWELFGRSLGRPLFYPFLSTFARGLIRKAYAKSDVLLFPSHATMHLFDWYKFTSKKILVPLGIDTKQYVPPVSRSDAKKAIGLDPEDRIIGFCGRIAHEKDIRTLVRAYLRIRDYYDDVKLLLVGPGIPELMRQFEKIRGVIVAGPKNNAIPYYQAMDIYVLPSLTETTSLSTLEAMSCETAVCSTPVGEVANYLKDKKNGFLFPKGNSFELSHALKVLLDDEKLRIRFGHEARKTVVEKYDWTPASKNLISILEKQLQPKVSPLKKTTK